MSTLEWKAGEPKDILPICWKGSIKSLEGADILMCGTSFTEESIPKSSFIIQIWTQKLCFYKNSVTKRDSSLSLLTKVYVTQPQETRILT